MRHLIAVVLSLWLCMPAVAQDEAARPTPGFLMFNQNIVAMSDLSTVSEMTDTILRPILDALVDEGKISSWGLLTHSWGDEWNWNWYIFAENRDAFNAAWSEMISRTQAAHPGAIAEMQKYIIEHKDNLYGVRRFRSAPPVDGQSISGFLMLNQSVVLSSDLQRWHELMDTAIGPVLDELLAEGKITSWGDLSHAWGDKWNGNWWIGTTDHAGFVTAWAEMASRVAERAPDTWTEVFRLIQRHKDNLYSHQYGYAGGQ